MTHNQRLLEQLERAEKSVKALPTGILESHPVWRELQERRKNEIEVKSAAAEPAVEPVR